MCKQNIFGINKKMQDIAIATENRCDAFSRTKEQEACVENIVAITSMPGITWTDKYNYVSKMFKAFELETLKKYNIK